MAEGSGLLKSSAVISGGVLLSRLTGFLRTLLLIHVLARSGLADVYTFANNVPNLVYELVAGGVLSAVLLPLFVDLLRRDDRDATSAVVSVAVGGLAAVTVAGVLAAPALGWAIASISGGSTDRAAQQAALTVLLRWFIPQVFFYGLITVLTALLQARRRFAAAAFAPVLNNLVVIAAYLLADRVSELDLTRVPLQAALDERWTLAVLGLGTTAGVVINAVALFPAVSRSRLRLRLHLDWHNPALTRMMVAARGALGYVMVSQIGVIITSVLANRYKEEGDFAAYTYANLFFYVAYGLLAVSITTALGPELATAAQLGDRSGLRREWLRGLRLIVMLMAPASAGLAVLSDPLMRSLPFTSDGAGITAVIFAWFALGLVPFSTSQFVIRAYYAQSETRPPFRLAVVQYAVIVGLGVVLSPLFGVAGLSAAYAIGFAVTGVVSFSWFAHRLGILRFSDVAMLPRMAAAAVAMAMVVAASQALLSWGERRTAPLPASLIGVLVGAVSYPAFLWALRADDDLRSLLAAARRITGR